MTSTPAIVSSGHPPSSPLPVAVTLGALGVVYFDFGDWIEHVLTLEAIEPPQPDAKYPRGAKRNTPKYANCVECLKKGKETTAIYVCLTCTKNPDEEWLLCEDCVEKHENKDHYVEKILS